MPDKKGLLTSAELRRMVKKHNELMSIKIPKGSSRDDIVKLIESNGYKVDHKKKQLIPKVSHKRSPKVNLPPPPPKKAPAVLKAEREARRKKKLDTKLEGAKEVSALKKAIKGRKQIAEAKKELEKRRKAKTDKGDEKLITLMKNIDRGKITREDVLNYEKNKSDIKEILEGGVGGLEGNVDFYDREVAKWMLKQLKRPSSDKVIKDASDEDDGTKFLDYYLKLLKEWKKGKTGATAPATGKKVPIPEQRKMRIAFLTKKGLLIGKVKEKIDSSMKDKSKPTAKERKVVVGLAEAFGKKALAEVKKSKMDEGEKKKLVNSISDNMSIRDSKNGFTNDMINWDKIGTRLVEWSNHQIPALNYIVKKK